MGIIHWVHLSDLHFNKVGTQTDAMREKLPSYISKISKKDKIDYVFFTGDIRFAPKIIFPPEVVDYFSNICSAAGIDNKRLFIVLGNHDIDRKNKTRLSAIQELEQCYADNDSVIDKTLTRKLKRGRTKVLERLKNIVTDEQYNFHANQQILHFRIETEDLNIVHVDSTLSYHEGKQNDFFIGTYALKEVLKGCNKNKPTIILSHYSPNSFDPMEQKAVLKILKDHSVQLWFAGHKHTDIIYKDFEYVYVAHSGNQTFERLTSPGFVEGILDTELGQGIFRVHRWNESAGWAVYPTLVDDAVCKGEDETKEDKTKYPFILDAWLKATGKKLANKNNINFRVRNYLKNYKGSTLLTQELATDLGLEEQCVIKILEEFQQKGFVRVLNYKKSQWEILCHPAYV